MKKQYYKPEVNLLECQFFCYTGSGEFSAGERIWDNETPLVPLK